MTYRGSNGLKLRRDERLGVGPMTWLDAVDSVLALRRGDSFACGVALSAGPVELPEPDVVPLTSAGFEDGRLPSARAWLRLPTGVSPVNTTSRASPFLGVNLRRSVLPSPASRPRPTQSTTTPVEERAPA